MERLRCSFMPPHCGTSSSVLVTISCPSSSKLLPTSFDACFGLLEVIEVGRRFLKVFVLTEVFPTCFAIFHVFIFFFFSLSSLMLMYCILQARSVFNTFQLAGGIRHKINLVSY